MDAFSLLLLFALLVFIFDPDSGLVAVLLVGVAFYLFPGNAHAGEWGAHLGTYHFDRGQSYQEVNPGVYTIQTDPQGRRWIAGAYLNSIRRPSVYLGRVVSTGRVDWALGGVTGYHLPVLPLIVPSVRFAGHWRASLLLPVDKHGGGLHLSYEF